MKNIPKNNFDRDELKQWFCFNQKCFYCGEYGFDAFHHIFGRGAEGSNSILNACPIHNENCHLYNLQLNRNNIKKELLEKTLKYLLNQGYLLKDLKERDKIFLSKHIKFYKNISLTN